jgi:hypothetical protein
LIPNFVDIVDENSVALNTQTNGENIEGNWHWVDDSIKYILVEEELDLPVYFDNA